MGDAVYVEDTSTAGTTFLPCIPVVIPDTSSTEPGLAVRNIGEGYERVRGTDVLVVEDNAVNQLVVGEFLKAIGISPTFASTGREGLDALDLKPFDLVLRDKYMPVMDGIEATRATRRSQQSWEHLVIVVLTADAMRGEEETAIAAGADGFAKKPIGPDALY